MNFIWRRIAKPRAILQVLKPDFANRSFSSLRCLSINTNLGLPILHPKPILYTGDRSKSKKAQHDSDDEDEDFAEDSSLSKDSKIVKFNTTSMRTDVILKSALNIARNKIEQQFYESRIRVNGKKILKKSQGVRPGDEIDIVKSVSPKNPDHLYVSRIEVLNASAKDDSILVTARRFKRLLIENYEIDPYKGNAEAES